MITVIICTQNRAKTLAKTLDSLKLMREPEGVEWELIVVDNNSNDETKSVLQDFRMVAPFPVRYAFEPRPGLSRARNTGVSLALGAVGPSSPDDIIAFTDDDVIVDQNWLVELVRSFERFDCAGVAGKIVAVWNNAKPSWFEDSGPYGLVLAIVRLDLGNVEKPLDYVIGANMAFRRSTFERNGFFNPDIGLGTDLPHGDETEFCSRLVGRGEKLMYAPKAVVYHPVEPNRINKSYFRKHAWNNGRYEARLSVFPSNCIRYFGVPRFIFRQLAYTVKTWAFASDRKQRFYYELRVVNFAGQIAEIHRSAQYGIGKRSLPANS